MVDWLFATLKQYPEIAIFLTLALGFYFGKFKFKGIGLGAVTATLLAGVLIGQIGIAIPQPLKATMFLMFLFAVGYGVGPQFVRGVAKDGLPQALFSVVQCLFCLAVPVIIAKLAGYDLGYASGLYSGSQTISAAMGLSTDAINRAVTDPNAAKGLLDSMPIAYAVTYMFGTVGSALVIALLGPALLRIDLVKACKDYEEKHGGGAGKELGGADSAWHKWAVRAFKVKQGGKVAGLQAAQAEGLVKDARVFVQRVRHEGKIVDATADTVLNAGDIVAVAGAREVLVRVIGEGADEVEDPELLNMPIEGVDVYVTSKDVDGKTLAELAKSPGARGVFLRRIVRGATATSIPLLPNTKVERGDILNVVGRTQDTPRIDRLYFAELVHARVDNVIEFQYVTQDGANNRIDIRILKDNLEFVTLCSSYPLISRGIGDGNYSRRAILIPVLTSIHNGLTTEVFAIVSDGLINSATLCASGSCPVGERRRAAISWRRSSRPTA